MPIAVTPEVFIKRLAAMLDAERDHKAVHMRSQTRALTQQFMNRTSNWAAEETVDADTAQRCPQPNELQQSVRV